MEIHPIFLKYNWVGQARLVYMPFYTEFSMLSVTTFAQDLS